MTTKMTQTVRMELANLVRDRYAIDTHTDKYRIFVEFVAATGYHEKSAIPILNMACRGDGEAEHRADAAANHAANSDGAKLGQVQLVLVSSCHALVS